MKRLVVIANGFPWGTWEPFLETELGYMSGFDATDVVSLSVRKAWEDTPRALPDGMAAHMIRYRSRIFYLVSAVFLLFNPHWYAELRHLLKTGRLTMARFVQLAVFLTRADWEAKLAADALRASGITGGDDVVLYCYRFSYHPYLAAKVRAKLGLDAPIVARAHRADLYEEVAPHGYIPMRNYTVGVCDEIDLVAQDGLDYLAERHPDARDKMRIERLGTTDGGVARLPEDRAGFEIVSCSNVVPVKRLGLLIDALALLEGPVHWTHIGDGAERQELSVKAESLPANIEVTWLGAIPNREVKPTLVSLAPDVFVNVSSSEGVPVSIMEALSTGCPTIATAAGGTGELVDSEVGELLPVDSGPEDVAASLDRFRDLSADAIDAMRLEARKRWEERSAAERLYPEFAAHLSALASGHRD